ARVLARSGASVMLSSRRQEHLESAVAEMVGTFDIQAANAGDPQQAEACVAKTIARFGRLDILVNNAATSPYFGPLIEADVERLGNLQPARRVTRGRSGGSADPET